MKKKKERYKDRAPDEFDIELYPFQKRLEPITSPIFGINFWVIVVAIGLALVFWFLSSL
jgi:hypothetical protein